ncbi:hypothetical protein GF391_04475 [Candidatus Uhrbacteria bacterium]|nr:hypothetical protein [Candidatus Uhrbacteria bacterium]
MYILLVILVHPVRYLGTEEFILVGIDISAILCYIHSFFTEAHVWFLSRFMAGWDVFLLTSSAMGRLKSLTN